MGVAIPTLGFLPFPRPQVIKSYQENVRRMHYVVALKKRNTWLKSIGLGCISLFGYGDFPPVPYA